jgi:hypothetical protein
MLLYLNEAIVCLPEKEKKTIDTGEFTEQHEPNLPLIYP